MKNAQILFSSFALVLTACSDGNSSDAFAVEAKDNHTNTTSNQERPATTGSGDEPTNAAPDSLAAAKQYFWQTFTAQQHENAEEATAKLALSYTAHPNDPGNTLRLAHSYLWRLGELAAGPAPDPSQAPLLAGNAQRYFSEALALAPDDARIYGWLGATQVANAAAQNDMPGIVQGMTTLETGVQLYPEFNLFVKALVTGPQPRDSELFASALEALWKNLDVCAGNTADRSNPDFTLVGKRLVAEDMDPACMSTAKAAHNWEGFFLYFGDLLTKAGEQKPAALIYDAARLSPSFPQWPYQNVLAEREQSIAARAALYANNDPSDDPLLVSQEAFNCSYCHAAAPSEALPF